MYNHNQQVHFVGIGGVGMAGIAEVLLSLGYRVSGSDCKEGELTRHLADCGAMVHIGHAAENLAEETSVVVFSSAVASDNPELVSARERRIPIIPRAEMLGELMRMKYGIAVAGSHGKTTTTTMIATILEEAGFDPTVIIGGRLQCSRSGARRGTGDYLVAEADESDGSFYHLRPAISVLTNIDREHMSFYGSFGRLESCFRDYLGSVPFYGLIVACVDDPVVRRMVESISRRVCLYGLDTSADFSAKDIGSVDGISSYTLLVKGKEQTRVVLPLPGIHLVKNSLAAIAVALELGVYLEEAVQALATFPGVARRSEVVRRTPRYLIVDDYGHHPTEISATISAIRKSWIEHSESSYRRLVVAFQPHRFSRTQELFADFLDCFKGVDCLFLTDIYGAGEPAIPGITGEKLAQSIQAPAVTFVQNVGELQRVLKENLQDGDVILTLGAGSITAVSHELARSLEAEEL